MTSEIRRLREESLKRAGTIGTLRKQLEDAAILDSTRCETIREKEKIIADLRTQTPNPSQCSQASAYLTVLDLLQHPQERRNLRVPYPCGLNDTLDKIAMLQAKAAKYDAIKKVG